MLPQMSAPIYTLKLPSNGKEIRVRPFLVKEEKLLLMAAQSKDTKEIIQVTKQIINNCLIDNDVKIDELPFFDIDYLFIALRAKSIGETLELQFKCNAETNGEKCNHIFPVALDIANVSIIKDETLSDKIDFGNMSGVKMKYPKYSDVKTIFANESDIDRVMRLIYASTEYIYQKDTLYSMKDYNREDFDKWIEGLTKAQFDKLEEWVLNMPTFEVKAVKKCASCGFEHDIGYKDFDSFFL
jgi:hypothetical protein